MINIKCIIFSLDLQEMWKAKQWYLQSKEVCPSHTDPSVFSSQILHPLFYEVNKALWVNSALSKVHIMCFETD